MNIRVRSNLRVLVVGLGSIGIRHLTNLRRLGCGHIGAYRSRKGPLYRQVDLAGVPLYENFDEPLGEGYDAVVICNPTSLHMEYARRAAAAGCHLYIEKPLSNEMAGTGQLLRTVQEKNLIAMVGCQLRFHPNIMAIKQWLDQRFIGRILSIHVDVGEYLPGWHPWEDYRNSYAARKELGGGVILTLIHEIDYLHWFFGPLRPIFSVGGISEALELDVEDYVTAFLLSDSSSAVVLHMDYLQQPACRRMKIVGSQGVIEWDYYAGVARLTVQGALGQLSTVPAEWERNTAYLAIMSDFLDAVCEGDPTRGSLEQGIATLAVAVEIKAQLSNSVSTEGRTMGVEAR